jgi:hypothetical protein
MKPLLRWIYILVVLAIGTSLSIFLVGLATSHETAPQEEKAGADLFPDYVKMLNSYYEDYENRSGHFHVTAERHFLEMEKQEACLTCHSIWPHQKDRKTRAFNNQHSRYMTCMVCHLDEQPGREDGVVWWDFDVDNSITRQGPYGISRNNEGELSGVDNFITKIVPVMRDGNHETRVYTSYSTPGFVEYRKAVTEGVRVHADQVRADAEALVAKEAITCKGCHGEESDFPWVELGFTGDRLDEMINSAVVGMIENYDSFYFPPVFE